MTVLRYRAACDYCHRLIDYENNRNLQAAALVAKWHGATRKQRWQSRGAASSLLSEIEPRGAFLIILFYDRT